MKRPPDPRWQQEEQRNARIRELRQNREAPTRSRRFQPVVLIAWFAGVIALLGVLIFIGFLAFAPQLMAWIEDHPGSIENGVVQDFVQWYQPDALADTPVGGDGQRITITVDSGTSDAEIGKLLVDQGLVRSPLAFQWAVLQAGRSGTLQAGTYDLNPSMRPSEIVAALRQEAGEEISVTIQEGWRLEQTVGYLGSTKLTMDLNAFARLVQQPPADLLNQYGFLADLPAGRSLEGYLYPDTYRMDVNWDARQVVELLLNTFQERFTNKIQKGIRNKNLSIDDAVTLASIVEREAVLDEERPLIAGVYLNRIQNPEAETAGLLNADPTLQYALATAANADATPRQWGSIEWWQPLETSGGDVQLPDSLSGYQTYLNKGLPPTPIASPRISSIAAVARAATKRGFYYFVAACPNGQRDGSHYFAHTYQEHLANIDKANAECAGA